MDGFNEYSLLEHTADFFKYLNLRRQIPSSVELLIYDFDETIRLDTADSYRWNIPVIWLINYFSGKKQVLSTTDEKEYVLKQMSAVPWANYINKVYGAGCSFTNGLPHIFADQKSGINYKDLGSICKEWGIYNVSPEKVVFIADDLTKEIDAKACQKCNIKHVVVPYMFSPNYLAFRKSPLQNLFSRFAYSGISSLFK
jgi:hypothetical protein